MQTITKFTKLATLILDNCGTEKFFGDLDPNTFDAVGCFSEWLEFHRDLWACWMENNTLAMDIIDNTELLNDAVLSWDAR